MPIKVSRIGTLNPETPEKEKQIISQRGSAELIRSVTRGRAFSNAEHLRTLGEESRDGNKYQEFANKTKLKGLVQ